MLTEFGSTVYGTRLPTSDTDIKGIFLPTAREILLQKVPRNSHSTTKLNERDKNTSEDIDTELFGFQNYVKLLTEGQTVAVDLLFTPEKHYQITPSKWWKYLQENKHKILHAQTASFTGYCKTQAAKYGIKGTRVASIRAALDWLKKEPNKYAKLETVLNEEVLPEELQKEFISIVFCKGPNGGLEPHLEVCNRKLPFHCTFNYAQGIIQKIFDEYGQRALLAEKNEGVDFKALNHAVRIAREAEELLLTGNITFPRPEKDLLLQIRKGELPYKQVAELIEDGLDRVEAAKDKSVLRDKPDVEFMEDLVCDAHDEILRNRYEGEIEFEGGFLI